MARGNINVAKDTITPRLSPKLYGPRVRSLITHWLQDDVLPDAKARAPKDTEAMANSLKVSVGAGDMPKTAGFKTDSRKFWYVHGRFAIPAPARRRSRAYWPRESQSLVSWARRKGIPVFLLRRAISQRGTPIVPFLAEAVERGIPALEGRIRQAEREIETEFNK